MVPAEEIVALSTDVPVASRDRVASCPGFAHALVVRSRCSSAQYAPERGLDRQSSLPLWMGARSTVVTPVARRG
jgi:hypothetical protein